MLTPGPDPRAIAESICRLNGHVFWRSACGLAEERTRQAGVG